MIVCPNCNHQNPDGAVQCEACYTPLPATMSCPNCGTTVQADASFCGQCGYNLRTAASNQPAESVVHSAAAPEAVPVMPELLPLDPLVPPDPLVAPPMALPDTPVALEAPDPMPAASPIPVISQPSANGEAVAVSPPAQSSSTTQLQQQTARLLHLQTSASLELPQSLTVIHIGKPNDRIPPDIDVSGFPDSEIVSRIHADIRLEGDAYYLEDVGSSNGTYINNVPLPMGNRHRLRQGDRIALGKGDKVTFLFQLS
ncbi:FHA domain-containing protein [Stenomitos frigidus]|uniref:Phosphopeptide-binding protein n=1 Tax=Stenomitos frigidus ULC18 TaxID=2107698 RepID=A0A2T1E503_9CYAN|nr:FHA domain-containing protein [Stenomitos frigidus]PSB27827.1 phosphopeptide-binding protein [Stenomitos frigidus ULC18]